MLVDEERVHHTRHWQPRQRRPPWLEPIYQTADGRYPAQLWIPFACCCLTWVVGMNDLNQYFSLAYAEARTQQPGVGRRQLKQQITNHFWGLSGAEKTEVIQRASTVPALAVPSPFETDPDPHDIPGLTESSAIGIRGVVVRTHFDPADQAAWGTFLSSLEDLERRSLSSIADTQDSESEGEDDDGEREKGPGTTGQGNAQDTEMAEGDRPPALALAYETDAVFVIIDPTKQELGRASQESLSNASNITLLRLFNDVLVLPAPLLPANSPKCIKPGHRLIDEDGFRVCFMSLPTMSIDLFAHRRFTWDQ
ncbi:hypothetical protein FRC10_008887 [Ceratobasidium sp. 414]|nr:hypothetical protein FRC10_008887 [Ceratobasidium sp. 414]